jgi:hypothetical protein
MQTDLQNSDKNFSIKPKVLIFGGGPAGLRAAWVLAPFCDVHLYEKESMPGRKFLVAGKGGLNLSHYPPPGGMASVYSPPGFMDAVLNKFSLEALLDWMNELGVGVFTGSSGKIFPEKGITPRMVLQAITTSIEERGCTMHTGCSLQSIDSSNSCLIFQNDVRVNLSADYIVVALGGASWPQTGSDGKWTDIFRSHGIKTLPFRPSNCGVNVSWPDNFVLHHAGKPLKNICLSCDEKSSTGEVLITRYGLEGYALYPLIPSLRKMEEERRPLQLKVDLKPVNNAEQLVSRLGLKRAESGNYRQAFGLQPQSMALAKLLTGKNAFENPLLFAGAIKSLVLPVLSLRPVEEAISSVGGLALEEVNSDLSLKKLPEVFAAGEMLNWDAPTGGWLIHGCFATGNYVALSILSRLGIISGV